VGARDVVEIIKYAQWESVGMRRLSSLLFLSVVFVLLVLGACSKGGQKKDKKGTDDLEKQLAAQRAEAERLARLAAEESKMCVAQSATEFQVCADGIDNDCDKRTDCDDVDDCAADAGCVNRQEGGAAITEAQIGIGP